MEELKLKKVKAYAIDISTDGINIVVAGYYKDSKIAYIRANGASWNGSHGIVRTTHVYEDPDDNIYSVEAAGKFKDDEYTQYRIQIKIDAFVTELSKKWFVRTYGIKVKVFVDSDEDLHFICENYDSFELEKAERHLFALEGTYRYRR